MPVRAPIEGTTQQQAVRSFGCPKLDRATPRDTASGTIRTKAYRRNSAPVSQKWELRLRVFADSAQFQIRATSMLSWPKADGPLIGGEVRKSGHSTITTRVSASNRSQALVARIGSSWGRNNHGHAPHVDERSRWVDGPAGRTPLKASLLPPYVSGSQDSQKAAVVQTGTEQGGYRFVAAVNAGVHS